MNTLSKIHLEKQEDKLIFMEFEKRFIESKGKSVEYKGQQIFLSDLFLTNNSMLKLIFEKTNSNWRQGIILKTKGYFEINSLRIKGGTVLWYDTAPMIVEFKAISKDGFFRVKNIWDKGDGVIDSGHNGAAMYSEDIPNGKRYYCNDGYPDDDFDDLIFTLERL